MSASGTLSTNVSGTALLIPNPDGATVITYEELFTGTAPATASIPIQGQMRGGTKDTAADTKATVAAEIRTVTWTKTYSGMVATPTWTGGDSTTTFVINWQAGLK
jgi:hypothetical protein